MLNPTSCHTLFSRVLPQGQVGHGVYHHWPQSLPTPSKSPSSSHSAPIHPIPDTPCMPYMPTLTPKTTPTDRHIWQSRGVSGHGTTWHLSTASVQRSDHESASGPPTQPHRVRPFLEGTGPFEKTPGIGRITVQRREAKPPSVGLKTTDQKVHLEQARHLGGVTGSELPRETLARSSVDGRSVSLADVVWKCCTSHSTPRDLSQLTC